MTLALAILFSDGFESQMLLGWYQCGWEIRAHGAPADACPGDIADVAALPRLTALTKAAAKAREAGKAICLEPLLVSPAHGLVAGWKSVLDAMADIIAEGGVVCIWGEDECDFLETCILAEIVYREYQARWPEIPLYCNMAYTAHFRQVSEHCDWVSFTPAYGSPATLKDAFGRLEDHIRAGGCKQKMAIVPDTWTGWDNALSARYRLDKLDWLADYTERLDDDECVDVVAWIPFSWAPVAGGLGAAAMPEVRQKVLRLTR